MIINWQPANLQNDFVKLCPLQPGDFEELYLVASDPLIWEQHPNKNRYQREAFQIYFEGAVKSGSAFIVYDNKTNETIGSSRFYEYDSNTKTVAIGYTFLARDHWGTTYNNALKSLMLNYAFNFAEHVIFHIGASNIRSQKAIAKLGAKKTGEAEMEYYGEANRLNFVYQIEKVTWNKI